MELDEFKNIDDQFCYKKPAVAQIEMVKKLASDLNMTPTVASYHTSKSIQLPVVRLVDEATKGAFLLRDNFYSLEIAVQSPKPINLSYSALFGKHEDGEVLPTLNWAWYVDQVERCRGYSWKFFTPEEMEKGKVSEGHTLPEWQKKDLENIEKRERFNKWKDDPSWYSKDWSNGTICTDGLFPGASKMWVLGYCFAEGIARVIPMTELTIYTPASSRFAVSLGNEEQALLLIRRIIKHISH